MTPFISLSLTFQAALQDHNYSAVPPPSPPRSPTPPLSPFPNSANIGVQPPPSQEPQAPSSESQSFSFGIAGYKAGAGSSSVGAYPSPHYSGPHVMPEASPHSGLKQTLEEAGVGPMTPLGEVVSSGHQANSFKLPRLLNAYFSIAWRSIVKVV